MDRIKPRRPSPGFTLAFVALLIALSGTAIALPGANRIDRNDIRSEAVNSSDIRNNSVRGVDIRDGTIRSGDIAANAATGADIDESTLGTVPNAVNAGLAADAALFGGVPPSAYQLSREQRRFGLLKMSAGDEDVTLANVGPFTLRAECDAGPDGQQTLNTNASNSIADSDESSDTDFDAGEEFNASEGGDEDDEINAATPSGTAITGQLYTGEGVLGADCVFWGVITESSDRTVTPGG